MGPVVPTTEAVYLDANGAIYSVERHPVHYPELKPWWQQVDAGSIRLVSSQLLILECLVGPLKTRDVALVNDYEAFFRLAALELLPLTEATLRRAAQLRAEHPGLKTPDAIHLATALGRGVRQFLSNDLKLPAIHGLDYVRLTPAR